MAKIIGEQHDVNQIAVDTDGVMRAIRSAAGIWDAAEMGISQEEVAARIRAADTPELRASLMVDLRRRALNRADLAAFGDKIAFAGVGDTHWHQLGVSVDKAMTSEEALRLGSLDQTYKKLAVSVQQGSKWQEVPGVYAVGIEGLGPDGTDRVLSGVAVSEDYTLVQPRECFQFVDDVLKEYGAKYDTVGAIEGGRKIWLSALMPKWIEPVLGDVTRNYIVLTNSYDATEALWCYSTSHRIVCANTRRQSFSDRAKGIGIRHTGRLTDRIKSAQYALGLSCQEFEKFSEFADVLVRTTAKPEAFISTVLDSCLDVSGISAADATLGAAVLVEKLGLTGDEAIKAVKKIDRMIQRREVAKTKMMTRYESETNLSPGSLWAAVQAVTEYSNHELRYIGKAQKPLETKFSSLLIGRADALNQTAFSIAATLAS